MESCSSQQDVKPGIAELITSVIMFDETSDKIEAHNKKWLHFARVKSNHMPQEGRHISRQHTEAAMSIKMWLLQKNMIVVVKKGNNVFPVQILSRNPEKINAIQFLGDGRTKPINISFSDIITNVKDLEQALEKCHELVPANMWKHLYVVKDFEEAVPYLDQGVCSLVEPGQYFELHLEDAPDYYAIARVVRNYRGFLLVEFGNHKRWIHMFSPFCHEIGWAASERIELIKAGQQRFHKHLLVNPVANSIPVEEFTENAVPFVVFRNNVILPHRIEEHQTFVYLDAENKRFYYAHNRISTNIVNRGYFFNVYVGKTCVTNKLNKKPAEFHIYHSHLIPYLVAKRMEVQIFLPSDVKLLPDESDIDGYIRTHCNPEPVQQDHQSTSTGSNRANKKKKKHSSIIHSDAQMVSRRLLGNYIGVHKHWTLFMETLNDQKKLDLLESMTTLKYVEVFRPTPAGGLQLCAAEVTGQKECMLRLKVSGEMEPIYIHNADPLLYHFGACLDMELAILCDLDYFEEKTRKKQKHASNGFAGF